MKTKKIFLAAAVALLAASCDKTESDTKSLEISPTSLEFEATGGTAQNVTVQARNVTWEYSVSAAAQAWMTVSQEGNVLTVSVADNNKAEQRTGQIRIQVTDGSKLPARGVTVTQRANANPPEMSISVNPSSLTFEGEGAAPQEVTVTSSSETLTWTAAPDEASGEWITATAAGDKLTVSVADNPDTQRRSGTVVITPSDDAADSKAIRIIQEGRILPPSLTVSPSDPIEIPYNGIDGKLYVLLTVTAENTEWSAKATDAEGKALDWATTTASTGEGYINLAFTRNTQKQPRSGFLVVTPTAEGLEEIRIPITQTAAPDHLSTLDGDLDLTTLGFDHGYSSLMPYAPDDTLQPTIQWELNLFSAELSYNKSTGKVEGSGHRLHFLPVTERVEVNDDDYYPLPTGTYTVITRKPYPDDPYEQYYKDAWTIDKGTEGTTMWNKYPDFWYLEYRDNEVVGAAPIVSGTITVVSKLEGFENSYVFEFDLRDDIGNKITGTYEGSIGLNVSGKQLPD